MTLIIKKIRQKVIPKQTNKQTNKKEQQLVQTPEARKIITTSENVALCDRSVKHSSI
jgi:hypothetical protein